MTKRTKSIRSLLLLVGIVAVGFSMPAVAAQAGKSPVKVFILAGQSNMEGAGAVNASAKTQNGGQGTLQYLVKAPATAEQFKHIVDGNGKWVVRDDVWIWFLDRKGGLTVGYGAKSDRIGPEFQFGHFMGDHLDNQVLLIKTAWGGKSLQKDFRPPSSGGQVGPFYTEMIKHVKDVLGNLKQNFPDYDGQGYEIAGFGWHQGWNDGCTAAAVAEYEKNMVNFIRDVRKELGVKDLPFVIANSGFAGRGQKNERRLGIMTAQAAAAANPEFKGTVICVETRDFFRPGDVSPSKQVYHWNGNAETYFLIGDAMGKAMLGLMNGAAPQPQSPAGKAGQAK
jgi:alpha-galactosidase